jgi:hypothetical protein
MIWNENESSFGPGAVVPSINSLPPCSSGSSASSPTPKSSTLFGRGCVAHTILPSTYVMYIVG